METRKTFIEELAPTLWFAIAILLMAAMGGCGNDHINDNDGDCCNTNDNTNNNPSTNVRVSSVGNIALLSSETPGAEDDFGAAVFDAIYDFTFTGGVAIVTGSEDLEVLADSNVEIWEVPTDKVTEFETLIRSYLTYDGWVPDLFPSSYSSAGDLKSMLTVFACGLDLPEYSPYECPGEYIPDTLFRRVASGDYFWANDNANKVLFLVK